MSVSGKQSSNRSRDRLKSDTAERARNEHQVIQTQRPTDAQPLWSRLPSKIDRRRTSYAASVLAPTQRTMACGTESRKQSAQSEPDKRAYNHNGTAVLQ